MSRWKKHPSVRAGIEQMRRDHGIALDRQGEAGGRLNVLREQIDSIENQQEHLQERLESVKKEEEERKSSAGGCEKKAEERTGQLEETGRKKGKIYSRISALKNEILHCEEEIESERTK